MPERTPLHGQLPRGVQDLFLDAAALRTHIEERLAGVFRTWGYARLIPPTFEYFANLALGLSPRVQEATYRFLDHHGQSLALRPDLTVQTARIVGTKLYDQPMPQRFYYIEPVFRYTEVQAGKQREFTQAGIELIGAASSMADAEVVAVAVAALEALGLRDFRVSVGQVDFFRAVLHAANLPPDVAQSVQQAVDRKSQTQVRAALADYPGQAASVLAAIPSLAGGREVLVESRAIAPWPAAQAALDHLADTYTWLERSGVADRIILDLGEARGLGYYTGLSFEAFAAGSGFAILNGGRYDRLVGQFGPDLPAVGFALGVDRVILALDAACAPAYVADILVAGSDDPACLAAVRRLRVAGQRIEMDVLDRGPAELLAYAAARGIGRVVAWQGDSLVDIEPERVR